MIVRNQAGADAAEDTWFQRALHCRVYCPDEARHIAEKPQSARRGEAGARSRLGNPSQPS